MTAPADPVSNRLAALAMATELCKGSFQSMHTDDVLVVADTLFAYLGGPAVITLIIGPLLDQTTGKPTGNTTKGSPMQLHDNEKVTFTVAESDAKGANVPDDPTTTADDVTWALDNASVGALTVSSDTRSCDFAAGTVGSGVLTVTSGALTATVAIDVIAAGATALTVTAGTPVPQ